MVIGLLASVKKSFFTFFGNNWIASFVIFTDAESIVIFSQHMTVPAQPILLLLVYQLVIQNVVDCYEIFG